MNMGGKHKYININLRPKMQSERVAVSEAAGRDEGSARAGVFPSCSYHPVSAGTKEQS